MSEYCEHCQWLLTIVDKQAEDETLWFKAQTITEEYLQRALRDLHASIERSYERGDD